jgi:hypothetical protein
MSQEPTNTGSHHCSNYCVEFFVSLKVMPLQKIDATLNEIHDLPRFCTFDLKNASATDYQNAYTDLEK